MAKNRASNMGGRGRAFDHPPSNISKHRVDQSDSAFAGLVKLLYGVLQCIHHIAFLEENLANSSLPKAPEKKVNPARSNLDITFDLNLTNQNWANQTMDVLVKHYANCLKLLKSKNISAMSSKNLDFDRAQMTAIKWGRKKYKTKLTESSVSEFYKFLSDLNPQKSGNSVGNSSQITTPQPARKKRARSSPPITPPPPTSKRPDLKVTPPLAARSKKPNQAKLPSSLQPSTTITMYFVRELLLLMH